uniref:Myosin motor domain-containing protein n=3 Tax=Octopus bimaculoides TaxID=37653 RepID=A0A0L8FJC4_OCTBM
MGDTNKDENAEETMEDLITLMILNHQTILNTLQTRYNNKLIYTYIGSILVAINPYKIFNIYGKDVVKKYEGCPIGQQPPHLFAIGSVCYEKMLRDWENQVVLISGESGSGKTESCKLIMQYVALVNRNNDNLITEQILEGNPLLESFGNAKTIRNDNSSRFGKYIELFFQSGSICGARTAEYLLERSRIVKQPDDERNYHVFYEMLSAMTPEEKKEYGLQDAPQYFYLNQGNSCTIPGRNDAENFRALTEAMDVLGFSKTEKKTIQSILASVLHLGNIYFCKTNQTDYDMMQLGSDAEIKWISYLLELSPDWLKSSLTTKVMEARDERLVTPFTIAQAQDARDAIAKALYCRLFTWLVERINQIVYRSPREKVTSMALLDIFGFEDISLNSFEQLCINYANETLQSFFNECIFLMEQKEYKKERINWSQIDFPNNQELICLISSKPSGIFHILDDECNFPRASDKSFLEKCHYEHSMSCNYEKPRMSSMEFIIYHYAGKVTYNARSFLEKNKDTLQSDVVELLCESKNSIICQMFEDMRGRLLPKTLSKNTGRYVTMKPKTPTVSAQFNESLASLVYTMKQCNPYFVRCIKPNNTKSPMLFKSETVMEQLKYSGILQTINIRKWGYPVRIRFPVFIDR